MPKIHTSQLHEFAEAVDACGGNLQDQTLADRFYPFELQFDTMVDETISPFSDEYHRQQLALYEEVSKRRLDQESGELHPVDIQPLLAAPNPFGIRDVAIVADQVRVLSNMLTLSSLTGSAHVLDMGAGHGFSSELFAFAGCRVHAIDIDPLLGRMSRERAKTRGYDIVRSDMNYDDVAGLENSKYQAAFFYQSLHHCLRPWELLSTLRDKIAEDGVIAFTGEPIQSLWWKHWGMRLDQESVYVARRLGWFETGWSEDFLKECFARAGMQLELYTEGYVTRLGREIGVATASEAKRNVLRAKAAAMGLRPVEGIHLSDGAFASLTGERGQLHGRPAFRQSRTGDGTLLFGPYIELEAGTYEFSLILGNSTGGGGIVIGVTSDTGQESHFQETFLTQEPAELLFVRSFTLPSRKAQIEITGAVYGGGVWAVSLPTLRRV